ncbi:hypothetical protein [Kouleothrix sp.]|uniref:hypothetical protein n=1 Tax=Kouleothrix sp. TaxID=2779161 RepID=UPI003918ADC6
MLEQTITYGRATYIHALGYDSYRAHLIITILRDPHQSAIARVVLFIGIQQFADTWDTDEAVGTRDLDTLIGLDEYPEGGGVRYCIRTAYREISFYTEAKPIVLECS